MTRASRFRPGFRRPRGRCGHRPSLGPLLTAPLPVALEEDDAPLSVEVLLEGAARMTRRCRAFRERSCLQPVREFLGTNRVDALSARTGCTKGRHRCNSLPVRRGREGCESRPAGLARRDRDASPGVELVDGRRGRVAGRRNGLPQVLLPHERRHALRRLVGQAEVGTRGPVLGLATTRSTRRRQPERRQSTFVASSGGSGDAAEGRSASPSSSTSR